MSKEYDDLGMGMLINEWSNYKDTLDKAKKNEARLRQEICGILLHGESAGAHKFPIHNIQATATRVLNYSLDQEAINELMVTGALEAHEEDCIRIKYELNLKVYNELKSQFNMSRIDELLTVKDGMPQLKIKV